MIKLLVNDRTFRMNEEQLRAAHPKGKVGVHYAHAFNSYRRDLQHLLNLRDEVLKDYPNMSEKEMEVWELLETQSVWNEGFITLYVSIPIDDYLKLRREDKIEIR